MIQTRIFDKEKQKLLIRFIDVLSVITIFVLILNFTIFSYILTFNEYIKHVYANTYMLFLVIWNIYTLTIKDVTLKFKALEYYAFFLIFYLFINCIDSITTCPEIGIVYFIPFLIAFNIFYSNRKTYLLGIIIIIIIIIIYLIDAFFIKNLWSQREVNEKLFTNYFLINIFISLFLSIFFTSLNVYIKLYKKPDKLNNEEVLSDFPNDLIERINHHLEQNKPYLNEDYSLKLLADELDTNVAYISKAINSVDGQNFHHLINHFRIKNLKNEIHNDLKLGKQNYTLEYYYSKFGFKNQSTFNKAFKRNTGTTPSDYINALKTKINANL